MRELTRIVGWCALVVIISAPARSMGQGEAANERVFFSGYGEMHYNDPSDGTAELDFHRLVFGFGYQFNNQITFHAELDFEHAFTEPELEFAYLDFFYREALSFRTGVMLMPVGPLNEFHEPPLFYSVERPYIYKYVIPTTWQEPGAGVFGTLAEGEVAYRTYLVGGLDASGFRASDGIREGRQGGAEAKAEDVAVVGRVEYSPLLALTLGASGYYGAAAQGEKMLSDAAVGIGEVDARVRTHGLELTGVVSMVSVSGADSISAHNESVVGERILGWYGEAAYRVLSRMRPESEKELVLFARVEQFNTHDQVADGFTADRALDRQVITFGGAFFPIPAVVLKADFEMWESDAGSDWEQFNVGMGFMY